MEHAQSEHAPRARPDPHPADFHRPRASASWSAGSSASIHPTWAPFFRPFSQLFLRLIKMIIAPLIFATLVAGIAGAGHFKVVGRMGLRAIIYFEVVTTLALVIGLVAVNVMRPGVGVNLPMGQQSGITATPQTWDQILLHVVPESVIQRDGRRRRAADRRLQHPLRDRARDDRREGPPGDRLVRGGRRDDVQVHEHRDALRADRRRRGDRLHRRSRRRRACSRTWPGWSRRSTSRWPSSSWSCCSRSR